MYLPDLKASITLLLKNLIRTPSLSREEANTAQLLENFLKEKGYTPQRQLNNVWIRSTDFRPDRPTLLLNSHHDTVKANAHWTYNPWGAEEIDSKIYGLGSNDAGASLVSLLATFLIADTWPDRAYNLIWAGTAEEEISGKNGIESLLPQLGEIALGIVGEPTQMQMAIAEKGLMVIDGEAQGQAGHAAREEGVNAIYEALADWEWIRQYQFPEVSSVLGRVKMSLTQVAAGHQHNVVPEVCRFVIDVRTNELYSNQEVFEIMSSHLNSKLKARSFRLNSSRIDPQHPLVQRGKSLGLTAFGSPTLSDQALMPFATLKIGPGDSARSHTADEFIEISEIHAGMDLYLALLKDLKL